MVAQAAQRKRQRRASRTSTAGAEESHPFDDLPDDLVVCILSKLGSSASRPSDFINVLSTCKRLNRLALHALVLSKAGPNTFAVKAENWSESAHRFLKDCAHAGNPEALYFLGMIRFYCMQNRSGGLSLVAKAAMRSHLPALYSLAVIQFNGSGGSKNDKDLRAGVALCARAAALGHVDALRELGHCLQDGYGVPQNVAEGRRLLVQANAREFASSLKSLRSAPTWQQQQHLPRRDLYYCACVAMGSTTGCMPLLSDFGCHVPVREAHPVNRFLMEWFESRRGVLGQRLRLCSYGGCGRPETRPHEFRRCSVCGAVHYCSRGCQARDWKLRHKAECVPMEEDRQDEEGGGGEDGVGGMVEVEEVEDVAVVE